MIFIVYVTSTPSFTYVGTEAYMPRYDAEWVANLRAATPGASLNVFDHNVIYLIWL